MFKGIYLKRSLVIWAMWFCCYLVAYGLAGWLPSIYRSVYKLSVQEALQYGLISSVAGLIGGLIAVALIDTIGRKLLIGGCLVLGGLPMLVLFWAPSFSALEVLALVCVSFGLINAVALSLGVYTAENYPTSLRRFRFWQYVGANSVYRWSIRRGLYIADGGHRTGVRGIRICIDYRWVDLPHVRH